MLMTPNCFSHSPIWHPSGDTHHCLPGRYLDVQALPKAEPGLDWACGPSGEWIPVPRLVYHHWQYCGGANSDSKEPGCDPGWGTNTAVAAHSCGFLQYKIRKKEGSALTRKATYVLIQLVVISRLDFCNSLLTGAAASTTRLLQIVQNGLVRQLHLPSFKPWSNPTLWCDHCTPLPLEDWPSHHSEELVVPHLAQGSCPHSGWMNSSLKSGQ